ncbi:alcohol dehydrogenase [Cohnella endophytica]|uniref:Alcohol dehydrogenase n=1 Tax=Cohnella endophytica TaxID=2419778 RepID=A0A494Y3M2_9BACL|nr:alcohol dehydrogenase catalytic domain-containing protein [Cohnella endophytica]RKP54516.1 alcohol dehydrogenase [Cohnella endophytica]
MKTKAIIVQADYAPKEGIPNPTPNQIYKNATLSIQERNLGHLRPHDIRVKMHYIGICGTDVHVASNDPATQYITCSAPLSIPVNGRVIGHEGVGEIIETGEMVTYFRPGMIVAFESIIACNQCTVCRRGDFNQCKNAELLGLEKDGLLGSVVDLPASIAHDLTGFIRSTYDWIAATNIEPAAVAYLGCENAVLRPGEKVVIFGAGPIGAFSAMLCRKVFGAAEVHVVEPNPFRRDLAGKWADRTYDISEFFDGELQQIDVVIETSAILHNITSVFPRLNANARVILLGRKGEPLQINDVDHLITNAITIKGSRGHLGGAYLKIMDLHYACRINLNDIVTTLVNGLKAGMNLLQNPEIIENENCKVIIDLTSKIEE